MADLLQELYDKYEILSSAKDKISEKYVEYTECINGTTGGPKEKKLAAQIISKFFKHFPTLQEQALNAIINLCEDDDSDIRICAMKVLPNLAKDNAELVGNIASILGQLLQLEDLDYTVACNSLCSIYKQDPVGATKGILNSIQSSDDESFREKAVVFLFTKLVYLPDIQPLSKNPELPPLLVEEGKKIIQDCTSEEFIIIMQFLLKSNLSKTLQGQQELINTVAEKIELKEKFEPTEEGTDNVSRLILCVDCILPLFSATLESTQFVIYYCTQVLPNLEKIRNIKDSEKLQLKLLRQLALLSVHCGNVENITEIVQSVFDKLKEYMPLPPEDVDLNNVPQLDFTSVECLLYTFHRLTRKIPEFLTGDQERLKDFRARLQYFSRGVQGCKRGLEKKANPKPQGEEFHIQQLIIELAPLLLNNINSIIKDLFYQPPLYKCNVTLSFKEEEKNKEKLSSLKSPTSQKRHAPITFDSSNGTAGAKQIKSTKGGDSRKPTQTTYQPPSGKFSNNFGRTGTRGGSWRGSSRGQRGFRSGGGGGRSWRN
ncbi:apoptosis inhibitor 5 [Anthonomus grandis grandis]|uniref:apoptosis inhibitor 5 n=1 Tax=Anthonomus grandis grandis TaxID=2921223 RepID=UPI002166AADF|nr:apoptosis inhibitor 5 [Anthonomus grandis grandis]